MKRWEGAHSQLPHREFLVLPIELRSRVGQTVRDLNPVWLKGAFVDCQERISPITIGLPLRVNASSDGAQAARADRSLHTFRPLYDNERDFNCNIRR